MSTVLTVGRLSFFCFFPSYILLLFFPSLQQPLPYRILFGRGSPSEELHPITQHVRSRVGVPGGTGYITLSSSTASRSTHPSYDRALLCLLSAPEHSIWAAPSSSRRHSLLQRLGSAHGTGRYGYGKLEVRSRVSCARQQRS